MNDETTAHDETTSTEAGAPGPGERSSRGRRRDRRPRGNRDQSAPSVESAVPSPERSESADHESQSTAPSASPRLPEFKRARGQQGFGDGVDRQICAYCVPVLPLTYPVQGRPGTAVAAYHVIADIEDRQLLCNELHPGECAWADLTPLDPAEAVSRNWSIVMISGADLTNTLDPQIPASDSVTI